MVPRRDGIWPAGAGASLVVDENYRNEMAGILQRLRADTPPDYRALREGLEVVRIADAIYRSDEAGRRALDAG